MARARGPLRLVTDRQQVFQATHHYPHGWVNETLECGHVHVEQINAVDDATAHHRHQTTRRRCEVCRKGPK